MRTRLALATAVLGALALAAPHALAAPAPKTLDGKAVKTMSITATSDLQNNADNPVPARCDAPRCAMLPFIYSPAKGVKGDVMFTLTWGSMTSDIDLYLAEVGKNGNNTKIANCGGAGPQAQERIFAPAGTMKRGKTYALVVDFYRSINDTAKGTIEMGVPSTQKSTVPANADSAVLPINCTL